jgi:hypothetical protein
MKHLATLVAAEILLSGVSVAAFQGRRKRAIFANLQVHLENCTKSN